MSAARHEICAVACADLFANDGEILASPMGAVPTLGARLARATSAPDLVLNDGAAFLVDGPLPVGATAPKWGEASGDVLVEGWLPFRHIFDVVWSGRRHVMMGAAQIDPWGNQNISQIGGAEGGAPRVQLLGARGAPGNTICHATSYFVGGHSPRVFVPAVDRVCGVGNDRAARLGSAGRFHDLRGVVTNLCVLDFATPDGRLRLASIHPGVEIDEIVAQTGFELAIGEAVPTTREPTDEELRLIREVLDPEGRAAREVVA